MLFVIFGTQVSAFSGVHESVFKITGYDNQNKPVFGTCFAIEHDIRTEREVIIISAAHVLRRIAGEYATVKFRYKEHGEYRTLKTVIKIRNDSQELFTVYKNSDLAAIKVTVPDRAYISVFSKDAVLSTNLSEAMPSKIAQKVVIFGYPFGKGCEQSGLAFARSGIIAGQGKKNNIDYIDVDFDVLEGFSGAPVLSRTKKRIVGMISKELQVDIISGNKAVKTQSLGIGRAIGSRAIESLLKSFTAKN